MRQYAHDATSPSSPADRLHRACAVWNLAALIASDCGIPALAADLCRQQFRIFHTAWPVTGQAAISSLQPLANLTRLTHRAGDPDGAYRELHALHRAVQDGGTAVIHGRSYSFDRFTTTRADRSEAARWVRVLLLEDGTFLLAATGQWAQAAAHAARYDEAGERLRHSRQTRIIAHLLNGHADTALALLDTSLITEPWEQAVAACLRTYSHLRAGHPTADHIETTLHALQHARHSPDRDTGLFQIRLTLTTVDLITDRCPAQADLLCAELLREAAASGDAFAGREVLRHGIARTRMTPAQIHELTALVRKAGLGRRTIPPPLHADLTAAVATAHTVLTHTLGAPHRQDEQEPSGVLPPSARDA